MGLISSIRNFYAISKPIPLSSDAGTAAAERRYHRLAIQSFIAGTVGYSLYYVCRTSLNVMKKPIIDSGVLDAAELGVISSTLLFVYAIGKFVNGFLCDHCNIKRFMMTGLAVSLFANLAMGVLGLVESAIPTAVIFICFAILWGINGWVQSMGSPPAIISLSRWFPLSKRGTYYGLFSLSHNLGEFLSFLFVGNVVLMAGWQWGFIGSAVAGLLGVILIYLLMHDTPQSEGLPPIETIANESVESEQNTVTIQRQVLRTPAVWVLAAASAFMYISRYAINGWGVLFLEEAKGFASEDAVWIVSINALLGIFGTVLSGWFSDKVFKGDRQIPALIFGVLNTIALALFIFGGNAMWLNVVAMSIFGVAMGVLICFLGGLMAVDIVPRGATGAALGIVGVASYIAAGLQDVISGWLIDSSTTILADGSREYDFTAAAIFWIAASVISFILPLFNWRYGKKDRKDQCGKAA